MLEPPVSLPSSWQLLELCGLRCLSFPDTPSHLSGQESAKVHKLYIHKCNIQMLSSDKMKSRGPPEKAEGVEVCHTVEGRWDYWWWRWSMAPAMPWRGVFSTAGPSEHTWRDCSGVVNCSKGYVIDLLHHTEFGDLLNLHLFDSGISSWVSSAWRTWWYSRVMKKGGKGGKWYAESTGNLELSVCLGPQWM